MKKQYIRPESQVFGLPQDNILTLSGGITMDSTEKATAGDEVEGRDEVLGSGSVWDSEW